MLAKENVSAAGLADSFLCFRSLAGWSLAFLAVISASMACFYLQGSEK